MNETSYVYVSVIDATPRQVWRALTDPGYIALYFDGAGPRSNWRPGAPVEWCVESGEPFRDWGQRVLESVPEQRLSYSWHDYEAEMAESFTDWTGDELERSCREPVSTVTFDIEPVGRFTTKLTMVHDGLAEGSRMLAGVSAGWPQILSRLKTVLEDRSGHG